MVTATLFCEIEIGKSIRLWYNYDTIMMSGGDAMPKIIPIRDLKNTAEISNMCHESSEPIYITKNGYGDMVIMSIQAYEEKVCMQEIYKNISEAEEDIAAGRVAEAGAALYRLRKKYDI